jgi:hypothetical protein
MMTKGGASVMAAEFRRVVDIRTSFENFVESIGGTVSDKLVSPSNGQRSKNADYIFFDAGMIAELKCLEEDHDNKAEFVEKRQALVDKWERDGLVQPSQVRVPFIQVKAFPQPCHDDLIKLYGQCVKSHLRSANQQIRESKETHDLPNAKGLLLLANDGNYSIEPDHMGQILGKHLNGGNYPNIDTVLFFTVNMAVQVPEDDVISRLWIYFYRQPAEQGVPVPFMDEMGVAWASFFKELTGIDAPMINEKDADGLSDHQVLKQLKFIKPTSR